MNERDIYLAAFDIADRDEQMRYVHDACGEDAELASRIFSMLNLDVADGVPVTPVSAFAKHAELDREPPPDITCAVGDTKNSGLSRSAKPGRAGDIKARDEIGPYRIIEQIGQGGMGTVYMAQQRQPVRRKVALKVIKRGMDSDQVVARFEAERQALALMNHPNIAHVLDAGVTDDGRPYFVMDLVKGIPITHYCVQHKLNHRERIELFIKVCQAVQHAHQKGVIHRDIKPSNVLVELHDVTHVPKVIDFGMAKATSHQLTDRTLVTMFSQLIGTPLYMSPEQAEFSGLDVDTRSDIYSLGVLLYELLTGTTPLDRQTMRSASIEEVRRMIREEDPPRPSQRISTLKVDQGEAIATTRRADILALARELSSELDWIVMKAMEKDRSRRYESASALAADAQRYLDNEPVLACPPSFGYRLRKLARRHRALLTTGVVVMLALLTATGVSGWYAIQANESRKLADQRLELSKSDFDRATQAIDMVINSLGAEGLREIPQVKQLNSKLLEEAAILYGNIVQEHGEDTLSLKRHAQALINLGMIYHATTEYQKAVDAYSSAEKVQKQLIAKHPDDPELKLQLSRIYSLWVWPVDEIDKVQQVKLAEKAVEAGEQALAELKDTDALQRFRFQLAEAKSSLSTRLVYILNEIERAEKLAKEAVDLNEGNPAIDSHASVWSSLSVAQWRGRNLSDAEESAKTCVQYARQYAGYSDGSNPPESFDSSMYAQKKLYYKLLHLATVQEERGSTESEETWVEMHHLAKSMRSAFPHNEQVLGWFLASLKSTGSLDLFIDEEYRNAEERFSRERLDSIELLVEEKQLEVLFARARRLEKDGKTEQSAEFRRDVIRVLTEWSDARSIQRDFVRSIEQTMDRYVNHPGDEYFLDLAYRNKTEKVQRWDFEYDLAEINRLLGYLEESLVHYDHAIDGHERKRWFIRKRKANALYSLGRYHDSLAELQLAYEGNSDDLSSVAWTWPDPASECPDPDYVEGHLKLIERAWREHPNDSQALIYYAGALVFRGQLLEAEECFDQSKQHIAASDFRALRKHYAKCLEQAGHLDLAIRVLSSAGKEELPR